MTKHFPDHSDFRVTRHQNRHFLVFIMKKILMITPVPSHPQTAGNRARIYNLAGCIKQLGHELYVAHVERETGDRVAMQECWGRDYFFSIPYTRPKKIMFRIRRKLNTLTNSESKYNLHIDDWYDESIDHQLKELQREINFEVVIVEYAFFSKALKCFPSHVLKIIDTHDVLTDRHKLYLRNDEKYNWFSTSASQEKKGLRRADLIIAIQDHEKERFAKLTDKKAITIGHTVKIIKPNTNDLPKSNILFIGSANQSNIDAIKYFIDEIFPEISVDFPKASLLVAGPVVRCLAQYFSETIVNLGEPASLDQTYDIADIVINPIRFGTGLKIKNIEALGYAKPLVTTPTGAEGMESGIGSAFLVADDVNGFSNSVASLLRDPNMYSHFSRDGNNFAIDWNRKQMSALQSIL